MTMTHARASQVLTPYVDGALPRADAAAVRAHLAECTACAAEVADLEALNHLAVFPAAPPVAFHTFWAGIEKQLPRRPRTRVVAVRRTMALAFALAAILVLTTGAAAFASDRIMPDSPLYSLKRVGEDARVTLTMARRERTRLQLQLAAERLREATKMAQEHKNKLAVASLKDFQSLVTDATPGLAQQGSADREETLQQIAELHQDLAKVEQAASSQPDPGDVEVQAVVQDSQATLAHEAQPTVPPVESQPTPTVEASPTSQPQETQSPTAAPEASSSQSPASSN